MLGFDVCFLFFSFIYLFGGNDAIWKIEMEETELLPPPPPPPVMPPSTSSSPLSPL
jgi:hypothetical protein